MKNLRHPALLTLFLLTPLLFACTTQPHPSRAADQKALLSAMESCLATQAQVAQQLTNQQSQMEGQQQQLLNVIAELDTVRVPVPVPEELNKGATQDKTTGTCLKMKGDTGKLIVGRQERVWLPSLELMLPARIDTGAETASLDARDIKMFERDGKRWVRFEIVHPESGKALKLERRLKRTVSIVQASAPEPERRPVIQLDITMGHVNQTAEFTLSDRSHLDYQVLVGRNILQDVMVVDVSKKNIARPIVADDS